MKTTDWTQVLAKDPVMADLIETHGRVDLTPAENEFERLCTTIINQQLSTQSAAAIRERVFGLMEGEVNPDRLRTLDRDALREAGLSSTKVDYLRNVADAFGTRDLTKEGLSAHSDEDVVDLLTEIKGIGEWSAHMFLMFVLGRTDILPLGDLAVRRGIEELYGVETRQEMREVAEAWQPYRSYGTLYIWEHYES